MLNRLNKYPLLKLMTAIAGALLLAHFIEKLGVYFWDNFLEEFLDHKGWMLFDFAIVCGLTALTVWLYRKSRKAKPGRQKDVSGVLAVILTLLTIYLWGCIIYLIMHK
jgi:hypothetical protein